MRPYVTFLGGTPVVPQNMANAKTKQLVGGQALRYTGILKFYLPDDGYGYITIDKGYALDPSVPTELRLERAEVNVAGPHALALKSGMHVEFGIWKFVQGYYKAYKMTLPGGIPVDAEERTRRYDSSASSMWPSDDRAALGSLLR